MWRKRRQHQREALDLILDEHARAPRPTSRAGR
jgi:hypothetical protein